MQRGKAVLWLRMRVNVRLMETEHKANYWSGRKDLESCVMMVIQLYALTKHHLTAQALGDFMR